MSNVYDAGAVAAPRSAIAWPAIFAGSVTGAAVSVILALLGAGFGLAMVSPWGDGASATTMTVSAAMWLVVIEWVAAGFAGYFAGRLRTRMHGFHTDEVFFRDTAHGFVAWSFSLVILTAVFASSAAGVLGKATDAAATVASGAASGAVQSAGAGGDYLTDRLFRPATATPVDPRVRTEAAGIIAESIANGQMAADDRTYLANVVATSTGVAPAEAESRVDAAVAAAKSAVDTARSAASKTSLFLALSLLVGAFISCVAAALGGKERDDDEVRLASRVQVS
jgi:hypothetical protein